MKFTCIPGEQWVIRREAFRLVKDSLKANGIEFAHRSVHVLMHGANEPQDVVKQIPAQEQFKEMLEQDIELQAKLAGGAASTIDNVIKKHDKIDHDFDWQHQSVNQTAFICCSMLFLKHLDLS